MSDGNEGLSEGWVGVTLADVTEHSKEKAEPAEFGDQKYIGLEHIEGESNDIIGSGDIESVKSTKAVFRSGDVLYGKLRPYLKKVCRPDFEGVCSTDILVYPEVAHLNNGYLLYFLSKKSTADYAIQNSKGINLPRISPRTLGEIEFPIPPLAEQTRIVSAIESHQARSSRARVLLSEVRPLIGQLRQSVLRNAFSGKLTADWRKQNPNTEPASELLTRIRTERRQRWEAEQLAKYEAKGKQPPKNWQDKYKEPEPVDESGLGKLPDGWCWASLDEIAVDFHQGINTAGDKIQYADSGYQILQAKHITSGRMEFSDARFMSQKDFDNYKKRYRPHPNYILFTNIGTIGKSLIVVEDADVLIAWNIFMIELVLGISPTFVNAYFNLLDIQGYYDTYNRGNATRFVNRKQMAKIPFPICPVEEQAEVSRIVDAFNIIERSLTGQVVSMESSLTGLDQSILSKAFRGELVPQDPRDEPASELLERIRQQREAAEAEKKVKKTGKKSRTTKIAGSARNARSASVKAKV